MYIINIHRIIHNPWIWVIVWVWCVRYNHSNPCCDTTGNAYHSLYNHWRQWLVFLLYKIYLSIHSCEQHTKLRHTTIHRLSGRKCGATNSRARLQWHSLVQWSGKNPPNRTWEMYTTIKDVESFHQYCAAPLNVFLPKNTQSFRHQSQARSVELWRNTPRKKRSEEDRRNNPRHKVRVWVDTTLGPHKRSRPWETNRRKRKQGSGNGALLQSNRSYFPEDAWSVFCSI